MKKKKKNRRQSEQAYKIKEPIASKIIWTLPNVGEVEKCVMAKHSFKIKYQVGQKE